MIADLKPYPAMKDSGVPWLGEVPEHWEVRRLKQGFCSIVGGSTPSSTEATFWDGDVVWITPADISKDERLSSSIRRITEAGLKSCSSELVPPGSIVVTSRAPVGNVALAEVELCTNQGCKALIATGHVVDPEFAFAVLKSLKGELQSLATGTTFTEISTSKLGIVPMPLPPLPEQSAIVRFLDYADRRIRRYIRAKQKLIKLLEEQKQAIIHRAVTRGLDPNVRLKPSGVEWLGDVPEHWDVRPAKRRYREIDARSESGMEELLSVSHLTGVTARSQKNITMFMAESYVGHKLCQGGDLVINTMWAWMGALGVARVSGLVSPSYGVYRLLASSELIPAFADLLLRTRSYIAEYNCRSTGIHSSRLRLYPDQFLRIPVVCPPPTEQRAILEHVARVTKELNDAQRIASREIDLLHEYSTRLIADVVTGKLDVRAAASALPDEVEAPESTEETQPLDEAEAAQVEESSETELEYTAADIG